ncbi:MAG: C4-dicarboxylic acid transporter DauA [Planctomycetes bacterium]|nr:C4-dicarboxylic acid transporter DauA [Planctomycetota bacterium]
MIAYVPIRSGRESRLTMARQTNSALGFDITFRPCVALQGAMRRGYRAADLRSDILAGMAVGTIAVPLSIALAIAAGVPPQHGLYTAIVAGGLIALLGGSRVQVSGPTAAFVVILAPISAKYGTGGLMIATAMAGVILMVMGLLRFGRLIQFIPHPVTTGFTAGIAVVIGTLQIKDFLGLDIPGRPEHYMDHLRAIGAHLSTIRWPDLGIGMLTLLVLIFWKRVTHKVPAPLAALTIGTIAAWIMSRMIEGFSVPTIGSTFTWREHGQTGPGMPPIPPLFTLPWHQPGPDGQPIALSWDLIHTLAPASFTIAMLGAIASLLSAVVADGLTGDEHDPDAELFAQGAGNLVAPFFGGIAATGAIARTTANVRYGARSPIAAIVHALTLLACMVLLAPLLNRLPLASLAALLLIVSWNMADLKHFKYALRVAPLSDRVVLLICLLLTVFVNMVAAVSVGIVLAALLFMRRMAEVADARLFSERHDAMNIALPPGVIVYEIGGPLFFGAAQKAMAALRSLGNGVRVVILDMREVPVMDATGLVNLESALDRLQAMNIRVVLAGVQSQPLHLLAKSHLRRDRAMVTVCGTFDAAMDVARWHAAEEPAAPSVTSSPAQTAH